MENEAMISKIMEWLRSQHVTMWGGKGWTVTSDDTCRQAAEWLYGQVTEFSKWLEAHDSQTH